MSLSYNLPPAPTHNPNAPITFRSNGTPYVLSSVPTHSIVTTERQRNIFDLEEQLKQANIDNKQIKSGKPVNFVALGLSNKKIAELTTRLLFAKSKTGGKKRKSLKQKKRKSKTFKKKSRKI